MRRLIPVLLLSGCLCDWCALAEPHRPPLQPDTPWLVLLAETGEERDGLPVLAVATDAEETAARLGHGACGTLLRVYRLLQTYRQVKEGVRPEPAYVLLSSRQGGYARRGFYLGDEVKSETDYVDVHREWPVTGEFGALDQIVPHELAHAIRRQLVGPLAEGGANQVHALGVRTDRVVAFNEGFAEHFQVMAFDHPDADPATRALADDSGALERADKRLAGYRRELSARLAVASRLRMGFVLWYSNDEDVLRYFAVKANAFAREPDLPEGLLRRDAYAAYLLENVLPGDSDGAEKSLPRLLASEGVISTLFHRWATHERLQGTYRDNAFYEPFGVDADQVTSLENVYLKLFHVFYVHKPQGALEVIEGYRATFPDEAPHVDEVVAEVLFDKAPRAPAEIWLANPDLTTGTTLFDQFRGLPRVHTFDLNAASLVDLASVPGVEPDLARTIRDAAPYAAVDDLGAVPGVPEEIVERFRAMSREMDELRASWEDEDAEQTLSINKILLPIVWRGLAVWVIAAAFGSILYRLVRSSADARRPGWIRTLLNGVAAALVSAVTVWAWGSGLGSLGMVGVLFGLPAALLRFRKTRQTRPAWIVLAAWLAAAVPALLLTTPWL